MIEWYVSVCDVVDKPWNEADKMESNIALAEVDRTIITRIPRHQPSPGPIQTSRETCFATRSHSMVAAPTFSLPPSCPIFDTPPKDVSSCGLCLWLVVVPGQSIPGVKLKRAFQAPVSYESAAIPWTGASNANFMDGREFSITLHEG